MEIINGIAEFGRFANSERTDELTVTFSSNVLNAVAVLTGFMTKYSDDDHHFGMLEVLLNINKIVGPIVNVGIKYGLRDRSGSPYDDPYEGVINFAVMAETESSPVAPRKSHPEF